MTGFSHEDPGYSKLQDKALAAIGALVTLLHADHLTPVEFGQHMLAGLHDWHGKAANVGTEAGGWAPDQIDAALGGIAADEQADYLSGFVDDIEAGRYDQPPDAPETEGDAIGARAALYGYALLGTAMEAWTMTQPPEQLIAWRLSVGEHCADCVSLANGSPYPAGSLPTYPAAGATRCHTRCRCRLEAV